MDEYNNNYLVCPVCGAYNQADSRFCFSCGAKIDEPAPAEEIPAFTENNEVDPEYPEESDSLIKGAYNEVNAFETYAEDGFVRDTDDSEAKQDESNEAFTAAEPVQEEHITHESAPEEVSAFAQGLPEWDIIPPQVMVRRHKN